MFEIKKGRRNPQVQTGSTKMDTANNQNLGKLTKILGDTTQYLSHLKSSQRDNIQNLTNTFIPNDYIHSSNPDDQIER